MKSLQRTVYGFAVFCLTVAFFFPSIIRAELPDYQKRLKGLDQYMEKTLKEWNVPGAAIGIVVKDKVVFAKGYGYRDYGKKLPVTPKTLYQIASNTKLFTATAIGFLVEEKKLEWDKPVKRFVPQIQFFNEELNNSVTIRDMLAHRTGISRHDGIWYKCDFSRKELFERLRYLEPSQTLRQGFLYNNMMYVAAGYIVELLSGKPWEEFVKERILTPLGMKNTYFSAKEMAAQPDHGVPYNERRDTTLLYEIPIYEDAQGVGPAGAIVSNIDDMSKWLITLMNGGVYEGKQVIPSSVLKATLTPSIALPNTQMENKGFGELFNAAYGMARWTASYRGHFLAYHGGDIDGFHSQISCMPYDSIGVVLFVIGDHSAPLYNVISYNVYERLLGLDQTPWSERRMADRKASDAIGKAGRSKSGADKVSGTTPSHSLADYAGTYENPAYGTIVIDQKDSTLTMDFHHMQLPLHHYHYDRFDSPNDEQYGLWSLNYATNPQGAVDRINVSLDESEAAFVRQPDKSLTDPAMFSRYVGKYEQGGTTLEISISEGSLWLSAPGQPSYQLIPYKPLTFRFKQFSDYSLVFVLEKEIVTGFRQIDPSGVYECKKKQ
jgi:CubicO group peptidase (beta-lactamase class C family)